MRDACNRTEPGERFGRLTTISDVGADKRRNRLWSCMCDCGARVTVPSARLRSSETRSCGCLQREIARSAGDRTRTHGMSNTSTYTVWSSMLARCTNPAAKDFSHYGGRGITVCERWTSFENFLADMGERPAGLSLERGDNDGPYSPQNCRWATTKEQNNNQRTNRLLSVAGHVATMSQWAERVGMNKNTLEARLRRGWSVERAVQEEVRK